MYTRIGKSVIKIESGMDAPGKEKAIRRTGKVRALAILITARLLKNASKKERDLTRPVASLTKTGTFLD
ncbi:MAG TPA: hypothetical protein VMU35_08840 [Methylomirabilota bacterium]|nr:hypothetical protein [Methylomirabilota bacterium]